MRIRETSPAILSALILISAIVFTACDDNLSPVFTPQGPSGKTVSVFSLQKTENPLLIIAGGNSGFRFSSSVTDSAGIDLVVEYSLRGEAEIVFMKSGRKNEKILTSSLLPFSYVRHYFTIPAETGVEVIQFITDETSRLEIKNLSFSRTFRGASMQDGVVTVSDGVSMVRADPGYRVAMDVAPSDSIVLRSFDGSPAVIRNGDQTAEAFSSSDKALFVPCAILSGGSHVSVTFSTKSFEVFQISSGPVPVSDLGAVLRAPEFNKPYSVHSWHLIPSVLIFDFKTYAVQDDFLKRLAFFAEKPGFRGRLAQDSEIAHLHGWNAHDYSAAMLAAFYEKARIENFPLNGSEMLLRSILIERGIISEGSGGKIFQGTGAIISISRESPRLLRRTLLDHEASHAVFFTDPEYRNLAKKQWDRLSIDSVFFWTRFFSDPRTQYDLSDDLLVINERQAYIVQLPEAALKEYYRGIFRRLRTAKPQNSERLEKIEEETINLILNDSNELTSYLSAAYGLRPGSFSRVRF